MEIPASVIKIMTDMYTKINKSFTSCYITNTGYVIDGNVDVNHHSKMMRLTKKYKDVIAYMFPNGEQMIFIDNIKEQKTDIINSFFYITDKSQINKVLDNIDVLLHQLHEGDTQPLRLQDKEVSEIFNDNSTIDLKLSNSYSDYIITIGKQLFPYSKAATFNTSTSYCVFTVNASLNCLMLLCVSDNFDFISEVLFI